jgi:hypothetical protein
MGVYLGISVCVFYVGEALGLVDSVPKQFYQLSINKTLKPRKRDALLLVGMSYRTGRRRIRRRNRNRSRSSSRSRSRRKARSRNRSRIRTRSRSRRKRKRERRFHR